MQQIKNAATSTATIVAPTGVLASIEVTIPITAHITDITAELIVTFKKLLNSLMDDKAGNMTSAEISSEPTKFIAITMIMAMTTAIRRLYAFALVPDALAKFSSNVTAKNLL